jgi:hypothetical protein
MQTHPWLFTQSQCWCAQRVDIKPSYSTCRYTLKAANTAQTHPSLNTSWQAKMHGQPLNMQMHAQPSKSVYSHIHAQPLMRAVTWGNMVSAQKLTKPWRFKVCSGQKPKNTVTRSALNTASTCWTLDVYCSIPCSQNEMFVRKQNQKRQESANKTWRRTQINAQLLIQVNTCRTMTKSW